MKTTKLLFFKVNFIYKLNPGTYLVLKNYDWYWSIQVPSAENFILFFSKGVDTNNLLSHGAARANTGSLKISKIFAKLNVDEWYQRCYLFLFTILVNCWEGRTTSHIRSFFYMASLLWFLGRQKKTQPSWTLWIYMWTHVDLNGISILRASVK